MVKTHFSTDHFFRDKRPETVAYPQALTLFITNFDIWKVMHSTGTELRPFAIFQPAMTGVMLKRAWYDLGLHGLFHIRVLLQIRAF